MAYHGNSEYFKGKDVDLESRDKDGKTILDLAKSCSRTEVITTILTPKLESALRVYRREEYKKLIDLGAPYSPALVESADEREKETLKIAISDYAVKKLASNVQTLLKSVKEGQAANPEASFADIKQLTRDIETHYNPMTHKGGLSYTNLSKHIGGLFRDAAKETGTPLHARRTFKQWASDIAHSFGYKKKEREEVKAAIGYSAIVESLKSSNTPSTNPVAMPSAAPRRLER